MRSIKYSGDLSRHLFSADQTRALYQLLLLFSFTFSTTGAGSAAGSLDCGVTNTPLCGSHGILERLEPGAVGKGRPQRLYHLISDEVGLALVLIVWRPHDQLGLKEGQIAVCAGP